MADTNKDKNQGRADRAAQIVRGHMLGSVASCILPIPLLDAGILAAIHLRMARKLAEVYEVEYDEQRANAIIGSLAGISVVSAVTTFFKKLPGVGQAMFGIGALTVPPATTYALGQVFIKHFESGGTFLTFDANRAKKDYDEKVKEGKQVVNQNFAGVKP